LTDVPLSFNVAHYIQKRGDNNVGRAQSGDRVIVAYKGLLENGEEFEVFTSEEPYGFELGTGIMPPGFENAVMEMEPGETRTVTLEPATAFGTKRDDLVMVVPRAKFGKIEPQIGMILGLTMDKEGSEQRFPALVTAIDGEEITVDFNHPLADRTITFEIKLLAVHGRDS